MVVRQISASIQKSKINIILASPRGFCAGVHRAVLIAEEALRLYGAPIYAKHEIVHNLRVVESLKQRGIIFIEDLNLVPKGARIIFSAHGVSPQIKKQAFDRQLKVLDATCPLVTKVHRETARFNLSGYHIILIGHANHAEVEGTLGYAEDNITLVSTLEDVARLDKTAYPKLAYVTQTTLSIDDCQSIIDALKDKFPHIRHSPKQDICYATNNRQRAVKLISKKVPLLLIIGSNMSSNTQRLVEIGRNMGTKTLLIESAGDITADLLANINSLGISAGASAPEYLVQEVIAEIAKFRDTQLTDFEYIKEDMHFALPYEIRKHA